MTRDMHIEHPILAIDHGSSRIGLAATDMLGIATHPAGTIQVKTSDPMEELKKIISQRLVKTIVIGMPYHMDGSEGDAAKKIRKFSKVVAKFFPNIPLHLIDERMTTISAAEKLHSAGKNAKKQKAIIDQAAAMEILNLFLEENGLLD